MQLSSNSSIPRVTILALQLLETPSYHKHNCILREDMAFESDLSELAPLLVVTTPHSDSLP